MPKFPPDPASVEGMQKAARDANTAKYVKWLRDHPGEWRPVANISGGQLLFGCLGVVALIGFAVWTLLS